MNVEHLDTTSLSAARFGSHEQHYPPSAREVLEELFNLLEDYAPTWYTEEHHDRALAALRSVKG